MNKATVKIRESFFVTHDVRSFITDRPKNFTFEPGQATEVAMNKAHWKAETRPFTFCSLPEDDFLQFIIKTYPDHKGVTNEMLRLKEGDELILHEIFGTITYEGRGTFIAGGAGITPFVSILRKLRKENSIFGNRLIFANKTEKDIILQRELETLLGNQFINILSEEKKSGHHHGQITREFLEKHITGTTGKFYVCGPPPMNESVIRDLSSLGIPDSSIIKEGM